MGFARKVNRNKIKQSIKRQGLKQTAPLSKYRFKTREEILKEQSEAITNQIMNTEYDLSNKKEE